MTAEAISDRTVDVGIWVSPAQDNRLICTFNVYGEAALNDVIFPRREAALAIVNDENWKLALRNCTFEGTKATTPMRKLIKKLPGNVVCHIALVSYDERIVGLQAYDV